MAVKITYAYSLAKIMRQKGYSVRRLATETGVDRAGLRRLRSGKTLPSWSVACKIADALRAPLDFFVGRKRRRPVADVQPDGAFEPEGSEDA